MPFTWRSGVGSRAAAVFILGLYACILLGAPFLHHDLLCHLRSRLHCTSYTSNQFAPRVESGDQLAQWRLPEAGQPGTPRVVPRDTLLTVRTTGRSPPF